MMKTYVLMLSKAFPAAKEKDWRLEYVETYDENGLLHGKIRHYYDNGIIREVREWTHGSPSGVHRIWTENGALHEFFYKAPDLLSKSKRQFSSGHLETLIKYDDSGNEIYREEWEEVFDEETDSYSYKRIW